MNLTEELKQSKTIRKEKEKKELGSSLVIEEAKKHLEKSSEEELEVLKAIGLGHNIKKYSEETKYRLEAVDKDNDFYGYDVFTKEDIKKVCVKYNLRFLDSKLYKGSMPPEIGSVVKRFMDETGAKTHFNNFFDERSRFKMMAPKSMFELTPFPGDPLLFYETDSGDYALVYQWGEDFTWKRRVSAWFLENPITNFLIQFLNFLIEPIIVGAVILLGCLLVSGICHFAGVDVNWMNAVVWPSISIAGAIGFLYGLGILSFLEDSPENRLISPIRPSNVWNLPFKKQ